MLLQRGGRIDEALEHFWEAAREDGDELRRRLVASTSEWSALKAATTSTQIRLGRSHYNRLGRAYLLLSDVDGSDLHDRALHHTKTALHHRIDAVGVRHVDVACMLWCSIGIVNREMGSGTGRSIT